MTVWFKDHADHHMSVLLDPRGPFYKCDMQKHRDLEHLELSRGGRKVTAAEAEYGRLAAARNRPHGLASWRGI